MAGEGRFRVWASSNLEIVAQGFFITSEKLNQMTEPMEQTVLAFSDAISDNFEAEGGPGGQWAPLQESTKRRKAALGLDDRILRATGSLEAGATSGKNWDIQQGGRTTTAELSDPTGYGFFHLSGTQFMPIRDWATVGDDALDEMQNIFADWMQETVNS